MIKPGTLCMIRGVPRDKPGYECNGSIVRALEIKRVVEPLGNVWSIDPHLQTAAKTYHGCAEAWLHPLDPCEDDLARETLERLDDEMRAAFINTVLEKI